MINVESLRKSGNKVMVNHRRRYFDKNNNRWMNLTRYEFEQSALSKDTFMSERGGCTEVFITTKDGKNFEALAECSKSDMYDRKIGVRIALGRAVSEMANSGVTFKTESLVEAVM